MKKIIMIMSTVLVLTSCGSSVEGDKPVTDTVTVKPVDTTTVVDTTSTPVDTTKH